MNKLDISRLLCNIDDELQIILMDNYEAKLSKRQWEKLLVIESMVRKLYDELKGEKYQGEKK